MQPGTRVLIQLYPQWQHKYPRFYSNFHGTKATVRTPPKDARMVENVVCVDVDGWKEEGYIYVQRDCCKKLF